MPVTYPPARRGDVVDVLHGVSVPDPYRWLEDPDAPEVRAWIEAENALTESILAAVPSRDAIRARLETLWNYERFGLPFRRGGRTFYFRNDGLQAQAVLWVVDREGDAPRVLLDPNTLSADGTVSLADVSVSPDGEWLAYGVSDGGSDWTTFRVREIATASDREDAIQWVKFSSAAWTPDGRGFFYARYPVPKSPLEQVNVDQKLYYHVRGDAQADDRLIYERPDHPTWGFGAAVTDDGELLLITVWEGTAPSNRVHILDLTDPHATVRPLFDAFDAAYGYIGKLGSRLWFTTDRHAPRGRVIAVDLGVPEAERERAILSETEDRLEDCVLVGGRLVARYLHDAHSRIAVHEVDGAWVRDVALPGLGSVSGFEGRPDEPIAFFAYTGFVTPTTIYRYDTATGDSAPFRVPAVDVHPDRYETKQVFVTSKDGTRVPMFLVHRKGLALDGRNPTMLYGYGGFDISLTPAFSVSILVWMELGGVYAVPNLRGGGEYGRSWHEAGTRERKQNVFDDFIAAAEWLIANGITSPDRLAIRGGSNGGLLVGAALTQRPDLFAAAIPQVGVLDMLRFHMFTIGWAWIADYGSVDDPVMFPILLGYSPYHRLKPGTAYPAVLITTGDHDDRVVPAHSFKFAAALQHAQGGPNPALIRIETRAGHGAGKPTRMLIDEAADLLAFLVLTLGLSADELVDHPVGGVEGQVVPG